MDNTATGEPRENPLSEALAMTPGDLRGSDGHPRGNFGRTAQIWSAIIGVPVTAEQVALCMIGLKLAREAHHHQRDNLEDMAGYVNTLHMLNREGT